MQRERKKGWKEGVNWLGQNEGRRKEGEVKTGRRGKRTEEREVGGGIER